MIQFPDPQTANEDGLVALGGDLSIQTLLTAYTKGIFPWPMGDNIPLPWFSPDPRGVIYTKDFHVPRSLKRSLNKDFTITFNQQFKEVIHNCAFTLRAKETGTWITHEIYQAYLALFRAGHAYSVEVIKNDKLVGGLYGVIIGEIVAGESMFSHVSDASKIALFHLNEKLLENNIAFLDTQIISNVVTSLGGKEIPRELFLENLKKANRSLTREQILGS